MIDPTALFRLETDTYVDDVTADVLLVALEGFMDAGHVQTILVRHLLNTLKHTVVATFDVDQLLDYRGRRPGMTFDKDRWSQYDDPSLVLYRFFDDDGRPFLLLVGPEPDFQWERFVEAVRRLMRLCEVPMAVSVHGIPMAVPHTRPVGVSVHATAPDLLGGAEPIFDTVRVPAHVTALLEYRLGESGERAVGYAVHVPHYLAQAEFPSGAVAALEAVTKVTGLVIPDTALQMAAADNLRAIEGEVRQAEDAGQVVAALEQQYDAFVAGRQRRALLAGDDSKLPTADQLAEEFEAFLRASAENPTEDGEPHPPRG